MRSCLSLLVVCATLLFAAVSVSGSLTFLETPGGGCTNFPDISVTLPLDTCVYYVNAYGNVSILATEVQENVFNVSYYSQVSGAQGCWFNNSFGASTLNLNQCGHGMDWQGNGSPSGAWVTDFGIIPCEMQFWNTRNCQGAPATTEQLQANSPEGCVQAASNYSYNLYVDPASQFVDYFFSKDCGTTEYFIGSVGQCVDVTTEFSATLNCQYPAVGPLTTYSPPVQTTTSSPTEPTTSSPVEPTTSSPVEPTTSAPIKSPLMKHKRRSKKPVKQEVNTAASQY